MKKKVNRYVMGFMLAAAGLTMVACSQNPTSNGSGQVANAKTDAASKADTAKSSAADPLAEDDEHGHKPGAHGGIIVSLGRDSYHVEAIVTDKGDLQLYTLGNDESRVIDIESQDLTAYVKSPSGTESTSIAVKPQPQPGDGPGKASLFVGRFPETLIGQAVNVTIPNITIAGERFRLGFTTESTSHGMEDMPTKVASEDEKELYLTPGGLYTQSDIEANGNMTVSQKFVGFKAAHDLSPKPGDKICPVTLTKANPSCTWIIGGKSYEFCCPPCVDEFVKLAKTNPDDVKQPGDYVKK